jgi:hypothetical protein
MRRKKEPFFLIDDEQAEERKRKYDTSLPRMNLALTVMYVNPMASGNSRDIYSHIIF